MPYTKNYKKMKIISSFPTDSDYENIMTMVNINGVTSYPRTRCGNTGAWVGTGGHYFTELSAVIGSGTKEFSEDDYSLESQIATGTFYPIRSVIPGTTLCAGKALSWGEDEDGIYVKYLICGKNTGDSPITISEIGITKYFDANASATSTSQTTFTALLYREVLDKPLTVEAGKSYEIVLRVNEA